MPVALLPRILAAALTAAAAVSVGTDEGRLMAEALALAPGMRVADVGAGDGEYTVMLAREVGEGGHVWATEVDTEALEKTRRRVAEAGHGNVTTVVGDQRETGLPAGCCDAIFLRLVYHHFTEPPAMRRSLLHALRPGGRLAVVEVPPQSGWRRLEGVPDRGGHGIEKGELEREMTAAGFEIVGRYPDWPGESDGYCVVFRRPRGDRPPQPSTISTTSRTKRATMVASSRSMRRASISERTSE
jgi:protein-L-isoaspartate O-methyltransferase